MTTLLFSKAEAQKEYDALLARPHGMSRIGEFLEASDSDTLVSVAIQGNTLPASFVLAMAQSDCITIVDCVSGRRFEWDGPPRASREHEDAMIVDLCHEAGDTGTDDELVAGFRSNHHAEDIAAAASGDVAALAALRRACGLPVFS